MKEPVSLRGEVLKSPLEDEEAAKAETSRARGSKRNVALSKYRILTDIQKVRIGTSRGPWE
jgi:hypothetical protein